MKIFAASRLKAQLIFLALPFISTGASAQTEIIRAPLSGWHSQSHPMGEYRSGQEKCDANAAFLDSVGSGVGPLTYTPVPPLPMYGECRTATNRKNDHALWALYCPLGFNAQSIGQWIGGVLPQSHFRGDQSYCARINGSVDRGKTLGRCKDGTCGVGNPITVSTGNKFQEETDYVSAGDFPLQLRRAYNSQALPDEAPLWPVSANPWRFGRNWRSNYDRSIGCGSFRWMSTLV